MDQVCENCKAILTMPPNRLSHDWELPKINNGRWLLGTSCRMCKIVKKVNPDAWELKFRWRELASTQELGDRKGLREISFSWGQDRHFASAFVRGKTVRIGEWSLLKYDLERCRSLLDNADFSLARGWIEDCKWKHKESPCGTGLCPALENVKVIDCERRRVVSRPEGCQYVALSYVWGKNPDLDIEAATLYHSFALPQRLPQTVEDAVTVTRRLGFRYLWVDRYCIDQRDVRGKHVQIQQMGLIYSGAEVTIVAASGRDSTYGLPGISRPRLVLLHFERIGSLVVIAGSAPSTVGIQLSKWATRAWTYQECYLSTKRLFFTDQRMVYVCEEDIHSDGVDDFELSEIGRGPISAFLPYTKTRTTELGKQGLAHFPGKSNHQAISNFSAALRYLQEYSRRKLSFDSDALNAIIGILNTLRQGHSAPCFQISGVPFDRMRDRACCDEHSQNLNMVRVKLHVQIALNWYHMSPARRREAFPGWSSLGWHGAICYSMVHSEVPLDLEIGVRTGDMESALPTMDLEDFTQVIEECVPSVLEVTGYILPLAISTDRKAPLDFRRENFCVVLPLTDKIAVYTSVYWDDDPVLFKHDSLIGLITASRRIVRVVWVLRRKGEYYERVGLLEFHPDPTAKNVHGIYGEDESTVIPHDIGNEEKYWRNPLWVEQAKQETIWMR